MFAGKKINENSERKPAFKTWMLMVSVLVIAAATIGGTVAFLASDTDAVVNTFTYATPGIDIPEEIEGGVKSNVKVTNESDFDAYVRAMVVVIWKDTSGNVSAVEPLKGTDYTMTMGSGNWVEKDGYYYYKMPVKAGADTDVLITKCEKTVGASIPEGYDLSVEVVAELIQAEPAAAVLEAWGLNPETLK